MVGSLKYWNNGEPTLPDEGLGSLKYWINGEAYVVLTEETVGTNINSDRSAKISGKLTVTSERSAKISGRKLSYHTKGDKTTLPTTTADLDTLYTDQEEIDVSTDDETYVNVEGSNYLIHQHAKVNSNKSALSIKWNGQSTLAPSSSTVYLQIYNFNTNSWETLSSNNSASANTDFSLTGSKTTNLTYYYDSDNYCYVRVYQEAV
jgi:hypothetical protein